MANTEHVAMLKKGVKAWNAFREKHPELIPDLIEASLEAADLIGATLSNANLAGAILTIANLTGADLRGANLNDADVSGTFIALTSIGNVDLSAVKGLDHVRHGAPSSIGTDTILKSGGRIPDIFLRGCGCDPLIQKILVGSAESKTDAFYQWISQRYNPLQRCFISYATEDKRFVERLQKALNERGVNYWYAPEHGRWGVELHRQIDLEISLRDRILLVCSEVSLTKDWVAYEIDRGIEQEKKRNARVIFPIMIDDALLTWNHPRATRVREVLAADFRDATKGHAFEEKMPRLLDALGYREGQ